MFKKKEYVCLFTGEIILARTRKGAHKYFEESYPCSYPCKVPFKLPLNQVITLKKYLKVYGQ